MIKIPQSIKQLIPNDIKLQAKTDCKDLFRIAVYFKEGLELGSFTEPVYELAREIAETNNRKQNEIEERIREFETGDLTFGEFRTPQEMAMYLLEGK